MDVHINQVIFHTLRGYSYIRLPVSSHRSVFLDTFFFMCFQYNSRCM